MAQEEKGLESIIDALSKTGKEYDDKFQKDQSDESLHEWKQTRRG